MKALKKIIYIIVILSVSAIVAGLLYLTSLKPQYSGSVQLRGLKGLTEILYDSYGIPHIYASNEEDAYMALGYAHAQDRLFQMEMIRRVTTGRLSEIFGKEYIPVDKFFKTLCLEDHAIESANEYLNDTIYNFQRSALAYLKGINHFIENGRTPIEFTLLGLPKERFKPSDLYLSIEYMAFNLGQGFKTDPVFSYINAKYGRKYLKDISTVPDTGYLRSPVFSNSVVADNDSTLDNSTADILQKVHLPSFTGSNAWVLSPEKSRSGKVLFANDAHIGYGQPSVWYEAHMEYPGFSFYGNHLAGFPFAAIGHSRAMTWGLTMLMNDDIDFYSERIKPDDKFKVWKNNQWQPLKVKVKTVHVKNQEDVECIVRISDHGPLMQGVMPEWKFITNDAVACSWTHLKFPSNLLQVTYDLNHAKGIDDARKAASEVISPGLNIIYGDSSGNIAWWAAAKLLKRSPSASHLLLMNGSTKDFDPAGYHDFTMNPKSENPPSGFIYNANNAPDSINGKFIEGYFSPDDRARRIHELLTDREKYSIEDFHRINVDVISTTSPRIAQNILSVLSQGMINKTPVHNKAYFTLLRWNGDHQQIDVAPTIYYRLCYYILKLAMEDEMGESFFNTYLKTNAMKFSFAAFIENDQSVWWDNIQTKEKVEKRLNIFNRAFDNTINDLVKQVDANPDNWEWGRVHQLEHIHPVGSKKPLNLIFNVGSFPVPGGNETINNIGFYLSDEKKYNAHHGPSMRIVLDFINTNNSMSILPTGQSGNVMSNYYKDQAPIYNNGKLRGMKMNREEIYLKKSGRLLLQPGF